VGAQLDDDAVGIGEVSARSGHGRQIYRRRQRESTARGGVRFPTRRGEFGRRRRCDALARREIIGA
jgi:hypothetical protein